MVISKSTAVVHPKPCIKEGIMPVSHGLVMSSTSPSSGSSTLPRMRTMTRRVAELPSLRYGPVGASCTISGPLKVRDSTSSSITCRQSPTGSLNSICSRRYTRAFTTGVLGDDVPAIRSTLHTRRVRFDLPPTDSSEDNDSPESASFVQYVSTSGAGVAPNGGHVNCWTTTRTSRTPAFTKYQSRDSSPYSYSYQHNSHLPLQNSYPYQNSHSYQRTDSRQQPVTAVTVVSGTTSVKQRAHPVGTYVKGTLSPTANSACAPGADPALLRAAREGDDAQLRDALKRAARVGVLEREINAVDNTGRTAISYVASNGPVDILESLLQLPGIDPNLPDNEGNTPLHFAAQAGQVECLNFLLSRCQGLEIDARNHLGFTPLMKAALQGRNKCAKLLLFAGANPTLRDTGRGLRAEQWARYCGRYVCADVIEKFARHRLLERSTSCGRWGSESDIGGTRVLLGKVVPVPPQHQNSQGSSQPQGIKSKLRKVFRTSSGPSHSSDSSSRLVTQLTSAALCASSPVLPASPTVPPVVKSLIRPLTVPRLQITLANGAATVSSDLNGLSTLLDQDKQQTVLEKPPRIKKKMK